MRFPTGKNLKGEHKVKKLCVAAVVVGLVVLVLAPCATATDMKGKIGFDVQVGYAMMDIKGVNDWFDMWEEFDELYGWATTANDHLKGGMSYIGEIKYGVASNVVLTGSGGVLSSEGKYTSTGPTDFRLDDKVSATFFGGGGLFVVQQDSLDLMFGGGVDYYSVEYEEDWTENGTVMERKAEGSKVGFNLRAGAMYFVTPTVAISGKIIYRIVKLTEIETKKDDYGISAQGDPLEVLTDPVDPWVGDTKDLEIDLSGINAYVNICFFFG